ncbi:Hint domain-containing protein [Cognatishimia sp. MH4019]|uniref:Hint domain-containing protein n=1 Tax=Cognatishimia sp. MH4019 TaxID=2854030 RepID=UPI001CD1C789|nr:Hint domain-containing protein [Cognatishimia sp. MH4019]
MPVNLYDAFEFSYATNYDPNIYGGGSIGGTLIGHTDGYVNVSENVPALSVGDQVRVDQQPTVGTDVVTGIYYSAITNVTFLDAQGESQTALVSSITITSEGSDGAERVFTFLTGPNIPPDGFQDVVTISWSSQFASPLQSLDDNIFPELFIDRDSSVADDPDPSVDDEILHDIVLTSLSDWPGSNTSLEFSNDELTGVFDNVTLRHDQTQSGEIGPGDELVINGVVYTVVDIADAENSEIFDSDSLTGEPVDNVQLFLLESSGTQVVALGIPDTSGDHESIFRIDLGAVSGSLGTPASSGDFDQNNAVSLGPEPTTGGEIFEFTLHDAIHIADDLGDTSSSGATLDTGVDGELITVEDSLQLFTAAENVLAVGDTLIYEGENGPITYTLTDIANYNGASANLDGGGTASLGSRGAFQLKFSMADGSSGEDLFFLLPSDDANSGTGNLVGITGISIPPTPATPANVSAIQLDSFDQDDNVSLAVSATTIHDIIKIDSGVFPFSNSVYDVGGLEEVHDNVTVELGASGTISVGSIIDLGSQQVELVSVKSFENARIEYGNNDGSGPDVIPDYAGDLWLVEDTSSGVRWLLLPQVDGAPLPDITSISFANASFGDEGTEAQIDSYLSDEDVSIGDPQVFDLIEVARPLDSGDSGAKLTSGIDLIGVEEGAILQGAGPQGDWSVGQTVQIGSDVYSTTSIQSISEGQTEFDLVSGQQFSVSDPSFLVTLENQNSSDIKQFLVLSDDLGDIEGISSITLPTVSDSGGFVIEHVADDYTQNDTVTLSSLQPGEDSYVYDVIRISSDLAGTNYVQPGVVLSANEELAAVEEPLVLTADEGDGDQDLDIGEQVEIEGRTLTFEGHYLPNLFQVSLADGSELSKVGTILRFSDDETGDVVEYLVFPEAEDTPNDLPEIATVTISGPPQFSEFGISNLNDTYGVDNDVSLATPVEDAFVYDAIKISSDLVGTNYIQNGTALTRNNEVVAVDEPLVLAATEGDRDGDLDVGEQVEFDGQLLTFVGSDIAFVEVVSTDGSTSTERGSFLHFTDSDGTEIDYFVIRDNDGSNNYPEIQSITITGSPGVGAGTVVDLDEQFGVDNDIELACFCRGTMIETPGGARAVEDLKVGDFVLTLDHGPQPIKWVGKNAVEGKGDLRPVRVSYSFEGNNREILVSPQHRVLFRSAETELLFSENEVLVSAKFLVNCGLAEYVESELVEYFHIAFAQHEIVFSNGIASESFLPGNIILSPNDRDISHELSQILPTIDVAQKDLVAQKACRYCLKGFEARLLSRDLSKHLVFASFEQLVGEGVVDL